MKKIIVIFCVIAMFLISGCAASKEARVNQIKSQYPQWDQGTVESVAERKISAGMTEEMVLAAMGKPWSIEKEGELTVWAYGYFGQTVEGYVTQKLSYFIYFRDKKVADIKGDKSKLGFSYR
ncbi:MAG: hypothetical protein ABII06_18525 [Pseudomonadota bacterium]